MRRGGIVGGGLARDSVGRWMETRPEPVACHRPRREHGGRLPLWLEPGLGPWCRSWFALSRGEVHVWIFLARWCYGYSCIPRHTLRL